MRMGTRGIIELEYIRERGDRYYGKCIEWNVWIETRGDTPAGAIPLREFQKQALQKFRLDVEH